MSYIITTTNANGERVCEEYAPDLKAATDVIEKMANGGAAIKDVELWEKVPFAVTVNVSGKAKKSKVKAEK